MDRELLVEEEVDVWTENRRQGNEPFRVGAPRGVR